MSRDETIRRATDAATKQLVEDGKLIEAGWRAYCLFVLPKDASEVQTSETRFAFFAGAQHLWGSMNSILDADKEPTEADMRRMSQINDEMREFYKVLKLRADKPKGSA